ncbi:Serine/threonine-protein kinase PknB [Aquisphaera giovannonii]|uniref:non-specific serine/threonine protein kinase n=1 Tax=Aquisphaera giovannonii TaxID=406548 RepID=A0A5B9W266_9BACT|nr:serine/threonine-protein kinase [Aquisphaera giovannonii]QEH34663.1 Serine/threonine-protein kinase PknB [Aquisphaera giovannonii]
MSSTPDPHSPGALQADEGDDGEILLEPTVQLAASTWGGPLAPASPPSQSFHMGLARESLPSITTETGELLRSRLKATAIFLALGYGVFFLLGLFEPSSVQHSAVLTLGLRLILCTSVLLLLSGGAELGYRQLRLVEYGFFGGMVLLMMFSQYSVGSTLIDEGDLPRLVAVEKNGIINLLVLTMLYSVFIPNDPRTTARVVMTMALGPFLVLAALQWKSAEAPAMVDRLARAGSPIGNMLFVILSAALAIYTSHILNHLRRDLHKAKKLGQYRLGEKLGEGGMGEVYLAEHQLLKRPCALKLIKPDVNSNPIALARFEREVQTAATLSHPNTIEIFDYGHADDGTFYYVMEYLPGLSVSDLVHQFGPLPPGRAVFLMRQVCGALSEAHRMGVIHRDLKPANVLVAILGGKCDVAKVLDFGLVKLTAQSDSVRLTADYTVSGTPQYMSPEQAMAADLDGRSDIYALGAILYFMLTGRPPFEGATPTELMIAHARDPVTPPSKLRPEIPPDLEAVILKCLEKKPDDRYPDARALSAALAGCTCAGDWDDPHAEQWWTDQAAALAASEADLQPA